MYFKEAFISCPWLLVLTCGSMFIAGKWLRAILTSTSCTNHALSKLSIWEEFSLLVTSWPYLVLYLDYSEMLIPWEVTFSLSFYVSQRRWVLIFGTHGVISWGMSRFEMFSCSFIISKLVYPLSIPNSSFFTILI